MSSVAFMNASNSSGWDSSSFESASSWASTSGGSGSAASGAEIVSIAARTPSKDGPGRRRRRGGRNPAARNRGTAEPRVFPLLFETPILK